jgi:hypothetical protein
MEAFMNFQFCKMYSLCAVISTCYIGDAQGTTVEEDNLLFDTKRQSHDYRGLLSNPDLFQRAVTYDFSHIFELSTQQFGRALNKCFGYRYPNVFSCCGLDIEIHGFRFNSPLAYHRKASVWRLL